MSDPRAPGSVLVLYDDRQLQTNFVKEHLEAFRNHSRHLVHYAGAAADRRADFDLGMYDAVIIHFTVRLAYPWHLAPTFAKRLEAFRGLKILLIQDEYDSPRQACSWIRRLGIQVVFTTVPEAYREIFYPRQLVGDVRFVRCLTGYVPHSLEQLVDTKPLRERRVIVGYRGRTLPFWYGKLAREKYQIGVGMKAACQRRGVPCDIEWTEDKRINGDAWYAFLSDCRTTLGTESGANIVDPDGAISQEVRSALKRTRDLTFEQVHERFLASCEREGMMNQVPPKVFEAIALRTALVLFRGTYSDVIRANHHYIPLEKDFSNIDEVIDRVLDLPLLEEMTERAHRDVVATGAFSYATFVRKVDEEVTRAIEPGAQKDWIYAVVGCRSGDRLWSLMTPHYPMSRAIPLVEPSLGRLIGRPARRAWHVLPCCIRKLLVPVLKPLVTLFFQAFPKRPGCSVESRSSEELAVKGATAGDGRARAGDL